MWQTKYTLTDILHDKWPIALAAFAASLVLTPVIRHVAYRFRVVDRPDDFLKPHGRPVAYMGGVAICLGFLIGMGVYIAFMPGRAAHWQAMRTSLSDGPIRGLLTNPLWNLLAIAVAGVLITVVGLVDDIRDLKPRQKLYGQVAAAGVLLLGGVGYRMVVTMFHPLGIPAPEWLIVMSSLGMCLVLVVATCNATNLLDGLDGLCGGVSGIITLGYLALATWLAAWGGSADLDPLRVALCLAMGGAVFGFLPYNIPPASIFLGDAGSMLIGFFVATMMATFCHEGTARWLLASLAVFALPILDTALAVVRRLLAGQSIFAADRGHLYDQLVDRGMSVKQVVVLFYFLTLIAAGIGVSVAVFVRMRYAVIVYAALLLIIWAIFWKLGMLHPPPKEPHRSAGAAGREDSA